MNKLIHVIVINSITTCFNTKEQALDSLDVTYCHCAVKIVIKKDGSIYHGKKCIGFIGESVLYDKPLQLLASCN